MKEYLAQQKTGNVHVADIRELGIEVLFVKDAVSKLLDVKSGEKGLDT